MKWVGDFYPISKRQTFRFKLATFSGIMEQLLKGKTHPCYIWRCLSHPTLTRNLRRVVTESSYLINASATFPSNFPPCWPCRLVDLVDLWPCRNYSTFGFRSFQVLRKVSPKFQWHKEILVNISQREANWKIYFWNSCVIFLYSSSLFSICLDLETLWLLH